MREMVRSGRFNGSLLLGGSVFRGMRKTIISWIVVKAASLACGILAGALLAIAVLAGGPHVWVDLATGDAGFIVEAEWSIALQAACKLAAAGTIIWMLIAWRRLTGYISAGIVGFLLSALMVSYFAMDGEGTLLGKITFCTLIGIAGMIAGLVTFYVDSTVTRIISRLGIAPSIGNSRGT